MARAAQSHPRFAPRSAAIQSVILRQAPATSAPLLALPRFGAQRAGAPPRAPLLARIELLRWFVRRVPEVVDSFLSPVPPRRFERSVAEHQ
jgi:hypothetical protein